MVRQRQRGLELDKALFISPHRDESQKPPLQRVSIPCLGRKLADIMYEGQGTLVHRARIWVEV